MMNPRGFLALARRAGFTLTDSSIVSSAPDPHVRRRLTPNPEPY